MTQKNTHTKIPTLRFPEFTNPWEKRIIKDLAKIIGGGTPSTANKKYWDGDINWFTPTEIKEKYVTSSNRKVTKLGLEKSSASLLPIGTILLTTRATIGEVSIAKEECTTNQGFQSLIVNELNSNQFVFNLIQVNKNKLHKNANGSTFSEISKKEIEKISVTIPNLLEQQKIASFLSEVDKKLNLLQQKKNLLEDYKKGVMQQIFSQELRFKSKDGGKNPEWEEKRLGEIGEVVNGLTYSPNDIDENGVLVLRSSNVQNRVLTFDDNVFVNVQEGNYNPVEENDILICVRNGSKRLIGKNAIINKEVQGVAFGAFMAIYRSKYNNFIFHLFDTDMYKKQVHRNLGATINSINGSDLKKFKIPFPCIEEQTQIANFLSALDEKIQLVAEALEATQQFKKGLLQQMFV